MGPIGAQYPKALLPVANRPLIEHHLRAMRAAEIREVHIVLGLGGDRIKDTLSTGEHLGLKINYVKQSSQLGSAHALAQLAVHISEPFVLMLGDYYLPDMQIRSLIDSVEGSYGACSMVVKQENDHRALLEACSVEVDEHGIIHRVTEKPMSPRGNLKGCGLYFLTVEFLDIVRRTPRTALRDEYELTVAIDMSIREGGVFLAHPTQTWDANLTRPLDLLRCNLQWLAATGLSTLVDVSVSVPEGSRLEQVVIGPGVVFEGPADLKDVVVFGGAKVGRDQTLQNVLVTPSSIVPVELTGV